MLFHKNHIATLHSENHPKLTPFTARRRYLLQKYEIILLFYYNKV